MVTPHTGVRPVGAFPPRPDDGRARRLSPVERNPILKSMLDKMVPDLDPGQTQPMRGGGDVLIPDPAYLRLTATQLAQDTTDAASVMQLLPDLHLVKNLLVSSIMAPKDLMSSELTFSLDHRGFNLPIGGRMLEIITDHFTNVYPLKEQLPVWLEETLFYTGSYPLMVIPENSIDAMIRGEMVASQENFRTSGRGIFTDDGQLATLGWLGPSLKDQERTKAQSNSPTNPGTPRYALESLFQSSTTSKVTPAMESLDDTFSYTASNEGPGKFSSTVSVTDNFNVLKLSMLQESIRSAKRSEILERAGLGNFAIAKESVGSGDYALGGTQRRTMYSQISLVQAIKTKDMVVKPMVGHPLIMRLPSESVIPIFLAPEKHLAYFVLVDQEGHPLSLANQKDVYHALNTSAGTAATGNSGASQMIQMAQNLSMGINVNEQQATSPAQMMKIYGQLLEHDLKARVASSGTINPNAQLAIPEEVYEVMWARSLKRQQTQILYVPAELMTYVAFEYAENGTGRSLLEQTKILSSMRVMLSFANVMAGIKNSVSRQALNIELSENDIDAPKTVARLIDEYTRRRNTSMPFASDPADMISYINMAGVEINVTGGKGVPQHKVSTEDKVSNRAKVDTELSDMLRDTHYMGFGITPDAITATTGADYAVNVITNNQMMAKRVIGYQDKLTPQVEDHVRKVSINDATIMNALRQVVYASLTDLNKEGDAEVDHSDVVDQSKSGVAPKALEDYRYATYDHEREAQVAVVIADFIAAIKVSLPRPDTATLAAQNQAFDAQAEAIDKKLSMILDSSFLTDANLGALASNVDIVKAAVKAEYMRRWMSGNGFLPEMEELVTLNEEGKPEFDLMKCVTDHTHVLDLALSAYASKIGQQKEAIHAVMGKLEKEYPNAGLGADPNAGGGGFDSFGQQGGGGFGGPEPGAPADDGFGGGEPGSPEGDEPDEPELTPPAGF